MDITLKIIRIIIFSVGVMIGYGAVIDYSINHLFSLVVAVCSTISVLLLGFIIDFLVKKGIFSKSHIYFIMIFVTYCCGIVFGRFTFEIYNNVINHDDFYFADQFPVIGGIIGVYTFVILKKQREKSKGVGKKAKGSEKKAKEIY